MSSPSLEQLARILQCLSTPEAPSQPATFLPDSKRHVGEYCIIRAGGAGVHAGVVVDYDHDTVTLQHATRLWKWYAAGGIALSGVARHGLRGDQPNKLDACVTSITIAGWCEIITCTPEAAASIRSAGTAS